MPGETLECAAGPLCHEVNLHVLITDSLVTVFWIKFKRTYLRPQKVLSTLKF